MAGTDTIGETLAAAGDIDCDVLVVGGGAAGLSAATYLARYGLETLVLARGTSAIHQCAHLENYLGFPAGVPPERFLELGRAQVEHEGGTVDEAFVEHVERASLPENHDRDIGGNSPETGGFRVETDEGSYLTRYVLTATAYDGDMLDAFEADIETEAEYGFVHSEHGRTAVDGLYAAGWMTDEVVHQAVVNAGHGARAAVSLARDDLAARYWPEVGTYYVDWVVDDDRYAGDEAWHEDTEAWFEREVLVEGVDDELADEALSLLKSEFLDRCLAEPARSERDRAGQEALLSALDDDVVREYVAELDATA